MQVLVDPVQSGDPFERVYAAWPFRFFVLAKGADGKIRVRMKAQPSRASYNLADVREALLRIQHI